MSVHIILRVWLVIPCRKKKYSGFSPEKILSVVDSVHCIPNLGGGGGGGGRGMYRVATGNHSAI